MRATEKIRGQKRKGKVTKSYLFFIKSSKKGFKIYLITYKTMQKSYIVRSHFHNFMHFLTNWKIYLSFFDQFSVFQKYKSLSITSLESSEEVFFGAIDISGIRTWSDISWISSWNSIPFIWQVKFFSQWNVILFAIISALKSLASFAQYEIL